VKGYPSVLDRVCLQRGYLCCESLRDSQKRWRHDAMLMGTPSHHQTIPRACLDVHDFVVVCYDGCDCPTTSHFLVHFGSFDQPPYPNVSSDRLHLT
jgi:hypothetical protein